MEIKKKSVWVQGGRGGNGNADCSPSKAQSVVSVSAVVEEGGKKNVFTLRWPLRTKAFRFSQASKDSGASDSRLRLL